MTISGFLTFFLSRYAANLWFHVYTITLGGLNSLSCPLSFLLCLLPCVSWIPLKTTFPLVDLATAKLLYLRRILLHGGDGLDSTLLSRVPATEIQHVSIRCPGRRRKVTPRHIDRPGIGFVQGETVRPQTHPEILPPFNQSSSPNPRLTSPVLTKEDINSQIQAALKSVFQSTINTGFLPTSFGGSLPGLSNNSFGLYSPWNMSPFSLSLIHI